VIYEILTRGTPQGHQPGPRGWTPRLAPEARRWRVSLRCETWAPSRLGFYYQVVLRVEICFVCCLSFFLVPFFLAFIWGGSQWTSAHKLLATSEWFAREINQAEKRERERERERKRERKKEREIKKMDQRGSMAISWELPFQSFNTFPKQFTGTLLEYGESG